MVIRVGIIGLSADQSAWATMAHVEAMKEGGPLSEHFKLTALVTSNPDSAKAAAKSHGLPLEKGYSNAEDIANDPDVDLVVVSVKVDSSSFSPKIR
jgi:predicted dehydrogenase